MKQQEQRNGRWANYETLAAAACLEYDADLRSYCRQTAENCKADALSIRGFLADGSTVGKVTTSILASRLESELTTEHIVGVALHRSLLRRSLPRVNWLEIADHFLTND